MDTKYNMNTNEINNKLFEYILAEVFGYGGDGDCLIVCKGKNALELGKLFFDFIINKYNNYYLDIYDWGLIVSDRSNESWTFTNNQEIPDWANFVIRV